VQAVGSEPTLLSEPDFESDVSTSSTTPAAAARARRCAISLISEFVGGPMVAQPRWEKAALAALSVST
jgi:hypothetical protein